MQYIEEISDFECSLFFCLAGWLEIRDMTDQALGF